MVSLDDQKFITTHQTLPAWLIPNPVLGRSAKNKTNDNYSVRSINNVGPIRFLVTEWDSPYTLEQQLKFIGYINDVYPDRLVMIVFSGDESYHAWWLPDGSGSEDITNLARTLDVCTGTINNKAQLVRMPNAVNPKTLEHQTVIYLNYGLIKK